MDSFTEKHLSAWAENTIPESERANIVAQIKQLCANDPGLIDSGMSWNMMWDSLRDEPIRKAGPYEYRTIC